MADTGVGDSRAPQGEALTVEELIETLRVWLEEETNVQSLKATFDAADKLGKDLTDRTRLRSDDPVRLKIGRVRA